MAKLYYGNGECNIDGEGVNIRGIEIVYTGDAKFECMAGDNFTLMNANNRVLIFPIGSGFLTNLFNYSGNFKITKIKVADENAIKLPTQIKQIMDYSELILTNAEDMTNHSEDLNSTFFNIKKQIKPNSIIENLDTSNPPTELYTENDELYTGKFHIHKKTLKIMSGATHGKDSVNLHIKPNKQELKKQRRLKRSKVSNLKNSQGVNIKGKGY